MITMDYLLLGISMDTIVFHILVIQSIFPVSVEHQNNCIKLQLKGSLQLIYYYRILFQSALFLLLVYAHVLGTISESS